MNQKEWLQRIEALEQEQRDHYAEGRVEQGDAIGEAICGLISEGRQQGFCLADGREPVVIAEQTKTKQR